MPDREKDRFEGRDEAIRAAIVYTLQLSDLHVLKRLRAQTPAAFVRALEQDGYTVVPMESNELVHPPDAWLLLEARARRSEAVVGVVRAWLDRYYGPIEVYDDGLRGMDQWDHGTEEYEARIAVAAAVRGLS
jgi:hypothetical protein